MPVAKQEFIIDGEMVKEWLDFATTKAFIAKLDQIEIENLKAIIVNSNKEEACGIVKGITLVKSLIKSAKEEGL